MFKATAATCLAKVKGLLWFSETGQKQSTCIWLVSYISSPWTQRREKPAIKRDVSSRAGLGTLSKVSSFSMQNFECLSHQGCQPESTNSGSSSPFLVPSGFDPSLENSALGSWRANSRAHICEILKELCRNKALGAATSQRYTADTIIHTYQMCSYILT